MMAFDQKSDQNWWKSIGFKVCGRTTNVWTFCHHAPGKRIIFWMSSFRDYYEFVSVCTYVCLSVLMLQRSAVNVILNLYNYRFLCELSPERTRENGVYEGEMRGRNEEKITLAERERGDKEVRERRDGTEGGGRSAGDRLGWENILLFSGICVKPYYCRQQNYSRRHSAGGKRREMSNREARRLKWKRYCECKSFCDFDCLCCFIFRAVLDRERERETEGNTSSNTVEAVSLWASWWSAFHCVSFSTSLAVRLVQMLDLC